MSQTQGKEEALRKAISKLSGVNLNDRLPDLGLSLCENDTLRVRAFGQDIDLQTSDWSMSIAGSAKPVGINDRILILHYLGCETPVKPSDKLISFRSFPGGQFYLQPFFSRTAKPLISRIGNDLELLKKKLDRFDWQPVPLADFGAKIHALGNLHVTLSYSLGDEEFEPACEILFDAQAERVYGAEDAAVLASRICIGLL